VGPGQSEDWYIGVKLAYTSVKAEEAVTLNYMGEHLNHISWGSIGRLCLEPDFYCRGCQLCLKQSQRN